MLTTTGFFNLSDTSLGPTTTKGDSRVSFPGSCGYWELPWRTERKTSADWPGFKAPGGMVRQTFDSGSVNLTPEWVAVPQVVNLGSVEGGSGADVPGRVGRGVEVISPGSLSKVPTVELDGVAEKWKKREKKKKDYKSA